ncbi:MAG: CoA-binding protein [Candidatus Coatesbacteria bacterium]
MTSRAVIEDFMAQKTLALAGVRRRGDGFGHAIRKEMTQRGWDVRLVHHQTDEIQGLPCVRSVKEVAGQVGGLILVTHPNVTERLVREAADAGIRRIWLQPGSASKEAVRVCEERGIAVVSRECILMYAAPGTFPHGLHRWFRGLLGRMPR